ncbi:hypothetical protein HC891_10460 [Candidatus Gracilibacteria bacterium]|nr:hypothetical protein [Candidatus Gracilibacteria bacterium]
MDGMHFLLIGALLGMVVAMLFMSRQGTVLVTSPPQQETTGGGGCFTLFVGFIGAVGFFALLASLSSGT